MNTEEEGLMTHEEFLEAKGKMRKGESLSRLEAGLMANHPLDCDLCKKELKKQKIKKP